MASFAGRRPPRPWTVEECAVFAARKEFELLKLLATDERALATARRLGLTTNAGQPHSHSAVASSAAASAAHQRAGVDDSSTPFNTATDLLPRRAAHRARRSQPQPHRPTTAAAAAFGHDASMAAPPPRGAGDSLARSPNARRRRSAARSARHHEQRRTAAVRLAIRSRTIAVLFVIRLRRRARLQRDLKDLEELDFARPLATKRGPESEPHSSSASSCDPHDFDHHHVMGVVKTSTRVSHLAKRFGGDTGRPLLR